MVNKTKNEVVELNTVVVVEAPKADFVLQISEAQHLDTCVELFSDGEATIAEGDEDIQKSALILGKVLLPDASVPLTYARWMGVRNTWLRKYMAFNSHASEESAQKAWERQVKRVSKEMPDVQKPSAPSKAAVKMSEKRKAEVEMLKQLSDNQLVEMLAAYKAEDNFTKANVVKKEIKDRNKSADDVVNAERKELREQIRKQLAQTTDIELLRKVSAMLPKLVMQAQ